MEISRQPAIFLSHGGGPWPYIPEMKTTFARTADEFSRIPQRLPAKPKAILSVSGHWEEKKFTVSAAARPPMIFDYSGFPESTYHISYPAPGDPHLAGRVHALLAEAEIECAQDPSRGLDHGTFVPLVLMYPQADIPVVSLSIKSNYDPVEHIRAGEALKSLRDEGVLILGSGLSYHNMRGLLSGGREARLVSARFEEWLNETIQEPDAEIRFRRLRDWQTAPGARQAHPKEDHLLPLMVIAGAAGDSPGERIFLDEVKGIVMASYLFPL